ncbi:MAG: acylphosphatase [Candidatus Methanomethyliaceae archaeon]|nr:acylphosphatase [Candidatus Methanomethyliaceae archaeon]MDW7971269.1 acylphosphatase [Nitrososphaerota archaeon]
MRAKARIIVKGKVQRVGFRYFTYKLAKRIGLVGYVKNLDDGSVEIVVEGEKEDIIKLISDVRIGPPGALVKDLEIYWYESKNDFNDFVIIR